MKVSLEPPGEPYIMHPLAVADILAHLQIDHITPHGSSYA